MSATVSPEQATGTRKRVYDRDGNRCVECGSTEELTLDHRIPRSRGGKNCFENLQTMCAGCNMRKGNLLPGETRSLRGHPRPPSRVRLEDLHPRLRTALLP